MTMSNPTPSASPNPALSPTTPDGEAGEAQGTEAAAIATTETEGTPASPESTDKVQYQLRSPRLPLAVYREVAAHLRQVDQVETGLLPQISQTFDYLQSQVGGVWIRYPEAAASRCQPQVEAILAYYGDRYGQWENLSTKA